MAKHYIIQFQEATLPFYAYNFNSEALYIVSILPSIAKSESLLKVVRS